MATQLSLTAQSSVKCTPINTDLTYAHEIPIMCTKLAKILNENPLFKGTGSVAKKCKVVSLAKWCDVRICHIFSANSQKLLGDRNAWHIYEFGSGNSHLCDADGQSMGEGVALWLYDQLEMCSYETLEKSYNEVFSNIVNGWEKSKIEDHPGIMFKEDPEKFELYIKNKALIDEDTLIHFIAAKFSLADNITCNSQWLGHPGYHYNGKIYLWIRKSALENVREKVGFKL